PVGKMFFQGATRLLASNVSVLPCRPTKDNRIVVEGYPALVVRKWIGKCSYKSDEQSKQTPDKLEARGYIMCKLCSPELLDNYGVTLERTDAMDDIFIQVATGDSLEALLCAMQPAWAHSKLNFGIPSVCNN